MNIALKLTLLRVALIPIFMLCFYGSSIWAYFATLGVFVIAASTDWLDGYLARSMHQTSRFGAFLDPVADKLLVIAAIIMIVGESQFPYIAIPALIIICREVIVSALREWMAGAGQSQVVAVTSCAKLKTAVQMTAIITLLIARRDYVFQGHWVAWLGIGFLYAAALLSVWTVVVYSRAALQTCK